MIPLVLVFADCATSALAVTTRPSATTLAMTCINRCNDDDDYPEGLACNCPGGTASDCPALTAAPPDKLAKICRPGEVAGQSP